jgi:NAD(P)-dependent dehydrogenase (short-subunit alcohol dehydrogenase family)
MSTVIVTGCNSGFGLAAARLLAERGDAVYATVLPSDRSGTAAIEQSRDSGLGIEIVPLDVTDERGCTDLVERVVAEHGRVDGLVNNAGVSMMAAFEDVALETVRQMFEVNFFAPVRLMHLVLPHMRTQGFGRIVNVTSGAGSVPMAWQSTYVAAKHALEGITFSIDGEVRSFGIRLSVVAPGVFVTEIGKKLWPATRESGVSYYQQSIQNVLDSWNSVVGGRDPADVGRAIAECIHSADPPIRVFVGTDFAKGAERRRTLSDDEWAAFNARPPRPPRSQPEGT